VAAVAVLGAGLSGAGRASHQEATVHLVLRPDSSVPTRDLAGVLDELKSDGSLVQTVVDALGSGEIRRRAAADADVRLTKDDTIEPTRRPGSAVIDATVRGPDAANVDRMATGFVRVASDYVATSYAAYVLGDLGTDPGGQGTGASRTQILLLALLAGGALGVGFVAAELRLESRRRWHGAPSAPAGGCRAVTDQGARCQSPAYDERGYCLTHLMRRESSPWEVHVIGNGSGSGNVERTPWPWTADEGHD
jgi:hypothetical protein